MDPYSATVVIPSAPRVAQHPTLRQLSDSDIVSYRRDTVPPASGSETTRNGQGLKERIGYFMSNFRELES